MLDYYKPLPYLYNLVETTNNKSQTNSFPYYNIITMDSGYLIELAVAGFKKDNLMVELDNSTLVVRGETTNRENVDYLHKGIASRAFVKKFDLTQNLVVKSVSLSDGVLSIIVEALPDNTKKKSFDIV